MSRTIRERMTELLNGTGSYRLTGSTSADWEVGACAAGLEELEQAAAKVLADLFPATASQDRLELWETLFQPQPGAGTPEQKRQIAGGRMAVNPRGFTPGDLAALLRAAGVAGDAVETDNGISVVVGRRLGLTEEECRRELDRFLPAHLNWTWVEEMNWTALDAWTAPFEELDARGLTWEELDAMTREQLEAPAAPEEEEPEEAEEEEEN